MKCRLLIGTDGVSSIVTRSFGFVSPTEVLSGFGAECLGSRDIDSEFVDIIVGNNIAPGFFAWVIPAGEQTRIGLCATEGTGPVTQYFKRFHGLCLSRGLVPDGKPLRSITGTIPLGVLNQTTVDNVMR